ESSRNARPARCSTCVSRWESQHTGDGFLSAGIRQRMKTPLAWLNLLHQKKRSLVAIFGVGFAALLVFMQLGFYGGAEGTATIIYDQLEFEVILLAPPY